MAGNEEEVGVVGGEEECSAEGALIDWILMRGSGEDSFRTHSSHSFTNF